jgi:hypothetical protein
MPARRPRQMDKARLILYLTATGEIAELRYRGLWDKPDPKYCRNGGGDSIPHLLKQPQGVQKATST